MAASTIKLTNVKLLIFEEVKLILINVISKEIICPLLLKSQVTDFEASVYLKPWSAFVFLFYTIDSESHTGMHVSVYMFHAQSKSKCDYWFNLIEIKITRKSLLTVVHCLSISRDGIWRIGK